MGFLGRILFSFVAFSLATMAFAQPLLTQTDVVFDGLGTPQAVALSPGGESLYALTGSSGGLLVFSRDPGTGALTFVEEHGEGENGVKGLLLGASIIVSPDGLHVYAAGENSENYIAVFSRDTGTGALTFVQAISQDSGGVSGLLSTRAIAIPPDGNHLYSIRYDNSVGIFSRSGVTGELTAAGVVTDGSGGVTGLMLPNAIAVSSDNLNVYVLGSAMGTIVVFTRDDVTGTLTYVTTLTNNIGGVAGIDFPRSIAVAPDGVFVYVTAGIFNGTLAAFSRLAPDGALVQTDLKQHGFDGVSGFTGTQHVEISPDSSHIYVAAQISNAIGVFSIDDMDGTLTFVQENSIFTDASIEGISGIRDLTIDSTGVHLYGGTAGDNGIPIFTRDGTSGALTFDSVQTAGSSNVDGLARPFYTAVSPDGSHVYVAGHLDDAISIFAPNPELGTLNFQDAVRDGENGVMGLDGVSSVAVTHDGAHVYATSRSGNALVAFSRNEATGALAFLEAEVNNVNGVTGLASAQRVAISPDGNHLYATAEESSSIVIFSRTPGTGLIEFVDSVADGDPGFDSIANPHAIAVSPDNLHVYVTSLNEDAVNVFSRNEITGLLTFVEVETEGINGVSGLSFPVDLAISPDGAHVYVASPDGVVAVFSRNEATGEIAFIQALTDGVNGISGLKGASSVSVSDDGAFVYFACIDDNSLIVFERDETTGELTFLEVQRDGIDGVDGMRGANSLAISPSGFNAFVGAEFDDSLSMFEKGATGVITGTVTDAVSNAVIPCSAIEFMDQTQTIVRSAVTDVNGVYFFDRLPPGTYNVRIFGVGYGETAGDPVVIVAGDVLQQNYELAPQTLAGAIRGLVTDMETNEPLVGVLITARIGGEIAATTYTCGSGEFEFNGLVAKGTSVELTYELANYDTETQNVIVQAGETTQANQPLNKSVVFAASLSGVVRGNPMTKGASPIEGARVTIRGPANSTQTTNSVGVYTFPNVLAGNYTIRVSADGFAGQSAAWAVNTSSAATIDVTLDPLPPDAGDPSDLDGNGETNAVDVQLVINGALGLPGSFPTDVDGDNETNAIDVQLVINGALGIK